MPTDVEFTKEVGLTGFCPKIDRRTRRSFGLVGFPSLCINVYLSP